MEMAAEHEVYLEKMLNRLRESERPVIRKRIEAAVSRHADGDGKEDARIRRYLEDLDIYLNMRGAEFMYARGIAESLRVGEEIFDLAYAMKRAMA